MRLKPLQDYFAGLITAPSGAAAGLRDLQARLPATPALEEVFGSTPSLGAATRIEIYANMYFFRLLEVLGNEYPKLSALLGADEFHNLITDYLLVHPSRHPDVARLADGIPDYLSSCPPSGLTGLDELARLELTRSRIFTAANPPLLLTLAHVQAIPPEKLGDLPLWLIPAFERLSFSHPAQTLWQALEDGSDPEAVLQDWRAHAPIPAQLRVWREEFRVFHKEIDATEAAALAALQASPGLTFAELCEQYSADANPPARAAALLLRWLNDRLIVAPHANGKSG